MARGKGRSAKAFEDLRAFALTFPEAHEDHPWGEVVVKVKKKVFVFLGTGAHGVGASVKLPQSKFDALDLPFCEPTGYGLGKAGWVSARFGEGEAVPIDLLKKWIDESYRAVAPKTLVKAMDAGAPLKAKKAPAKKQKVVTKKKAAR